VDVAGVHTKRQLSREEFDVKFAGMIRKFVPPVALALAAAMAFTSCDTPGEGAAHGAMIGAAVGGLHTGKLRGAAAGAAIGAATGALIGKIHEDRRRAHYRSGRYYYDDGVAVPYPVAHLTRRPGFVTSPYPPHALIDVRGIPHGATVLDPASGEPFINP
jgi:hypothetical protein